MIIGKVHPFPMIHRSQALLDSSGAGDDIPADNPDGSTSDIWREHVKGNFVKACLSGVFPPDRWSMACCTTFTGLTNCFARSGGMFQKLTDRARRLLVLSQDEARMLNHDHIGTEHLLLGMIREGEGVGATVLKDLGLSLEGLRRQVKESQGRGQSAASGHLLFTLSAGEALQASNQESLQRDLDYIGTEHLLLGLVRDGRVQRPGRWSSSGSTSATSGAP
ncbi:Clp protease N-terminal domain-containing protein [Nonomuraea jabiensis]|uniref:Clp protease N-terminal domain-containing protein n=1 Tax=Nonomuraea jabiensis TaxID=882448 RepID=UPI0036A4FBFE